MRSCVHTYVRPCVRARVCMYVCVFYNFALRIKDTSDKNNHMTEGVHTNCVHITIPTIRYPGCIALSFTLTVPTYVVDVSRAARSIEHLHVVTRMYIIRVIRQPERPVWIEAAVFRVEPADARLNRENATCGKPCVTSIDLFV